MQRKSFQVLTALMILWVQAPALAQIFGPPAPPPPTPTVEISGSLLEKGTRKPLANVNLYCFSPATNPVPLKIITDSTGKFTIRVPVGEVRWHVALANYEVFDLPETVTETTVHEAEKFYLEKQSYLTYETTVFGQTENRDDKTKTLTQDQFLTVPGANGDPVKAVQNLPGVNRGNAFNAQVIIEGSAPQDTRYSIDTQEVPIIFHFSGLSSVVIPEAVDHVDYLSSGFGPEYGQTIAGLVNLSTKDPQTDRWHGMGYVDIFNLGGMTEGPINDHSSLLVGFRQSYIGVILGAASKTSAGSKFDLTVAPDFKDLIVEYKNKISETDNFKLVMVGSIDTLEFVSPEPADQDPSVRGNFSLNTSFFRILPEYTHKFDADTTGHLWFGFGEDSTNQNIGSYYYNDVGPVVSGRAELEKQVTSSWKTYVGLDNYMSWAKIDFQVPYTASSQTGSQLPLGASTLQTSANTYFLDSTAGYWRNVVHFDDSRWTYLPGFRLDYFSQTKEFIPEPRLGLKYALDHGLTLRGATGLYSQAPPPQDFDPSYGNPQLKSEDAVHVTMGAEKDFKEGSQEGWLVSSDAFYKSLTHLVQATSDLNSSGQALYYNNDGSGKVYGLELLAKYQSAGWTGWIAYTLSRSTRTYPPNAEQIFQYDQTHNLTVVADKGFGNNWKFSGRVRYTTGDPYTPEIGGTFDADNDIYIPIAGGAYSQRLNPFFEVDVRFDKKWIYKTWIMTAYWDVENATNNKNPQAINYSYNYQQQAVINGLPLLPTFGLKGEF